MKSRATVEIPIKVLESIETLEELEDWLTANNPRVMRELREARAEDVSDQFRHWKPRHAPGPDHAK